MSKNAVKPPAASAARAGREAFPVGPAGLVEVHVRVQAAGQDVQAAGVELLATAARELGLDGGDRAVEHADVRGHRSGRRDHRPVAHDQVVHRPSRKRVAASIATATSSRETDSSG